MKNSATIVVAALVFALVGTMVFAAIAPNVSIVKADPGKLHDPCGPKKDSFPPCGGNKKG